MRAGALLALLLASGASGATAAPAETGLPPPSLAATVAPPPLPPALREALAAAPTDPVRQAEWLLQTRDPRLRADAAFARLHALLPDLPAAPDAAFAEALGDHVRDPELRCRRPLFTRYVAERFGGPAPACGGDAPFRVLSRTEGAGLRWLDPARVRAIHLLYGGPNQALASRFGHVGLRLVVCPAADASDEACAVNVGEHLVLGYRAHVDEIALSIGKAFSGGYPLYLYAQPFLEVYREYAIDEFRTVYSLPLAVPAQERERMVRELAELHIRAAGNYRYMSRNCATQLQRALRVLWPGYAADPALQWLRLRPDSLFDGLRDSASVLPGALADAARAEREGFLFPSTRPYYERAVARVAAALPGAGFATLEEFLRQAPAARAAARRADAGFAAALARDRELREAQLLLEEYAMLWSERRLLAAIGGYVAGEDWGALEVRLRNAVTATEATAIEDCLLRPLRQRSQPPRARELPRRETTVAPPAQGLACTRPDTVATLGAGLRRFLQDDSAPARDILRLAEYHARSVLNLAELRNDTGG